MKEFKLAVFIGRFQPVHNSHLEAIRQALNIADNLLIIIGSANCAPNVKNPFSAQEREEMIKNALTSEENNRVRFASIRDYYYNENNWIINVQNIVAQLKSRLDIEDEEITLMGNYKDSSSYYLQLFPQWQFTAIKNLTVLNATDVRKILYEVCTETRWKDKNMEKSYALDVYADEELKKLVPNNVFNHIQDNFIGTDRHSILVKEYDYIKRYKDQWHNSPFPPTFVTTDCVVVKSGHVLVVKRKFEPGKGLYALPGGFIKQNETLLSGALRELKEETKIKVHKPVLEAAIKSNHVFDFPERSLRGRTITHAFHIDLGSGELPEVKGSDDASGAEWVPLYDLKEDSFFEDHFYVIQYFLNK